MRVIRRAHALAACAAVTALCAATGTIEVHADTGWSSWCSSNGWHAVTISSDPTLVVSIGGPYNQETPTVALCYGTSADGQPSGGELIGGAAGVGVDNTAVPTSPEFVACFPDADSALAPACEAAANPTATWSPAPPPAIGGTLTVTVPFVVCAGINVVVGTTCADRTANPPSLAATGLIVSSVAVQGGPSCCPDGATLAPTTTVYVNGVPEATTVGTGGGANPSAIGTGSTGSSATLLCLPSSQCVTVPGSWIGTSGAPAAELVVGGTALPIAPVGQECITVATSSDTCPAPF